MPVYMIQAGGEHGPVKIGVTDDVEKRLIGMQTGNHQRLVVLRLFEGGAAEERLLHERFADHRLDGEWFSFSKQMLSDVELTEMTALTGESLNVFNRMNELCARRREIGDDARFLEELTTKDSAMLHQLARRLRMPLWQHLGLPNPFPTDEA
ncbi:MAG TPA: GIY-YIG nuclease family protein [Xanthobacteraceae bacterium]